MTCGTCHDPHEVTANDWREPVTVPGLKKQCQDCHAAQAAVFAKNEMHGANKCSSCHMPTMMSCENFGTIQYPDYAGFDTQRTSHIWKILVDPEAKTLNPPPGKDRNYKDGAWRLARHDGKPYIDLQWSCGRTSWGDDDLRSAGGCHSPVVSTLRPGLQFRSQRQIYEIVNGWQRPVKDCAAEARALIAQARPAVASSKLSRAKLAEATHLLNDAEEILAALDRDGSHGVHAPAYSLEKVKEAKLLAEGALDVLGVKARNAKSVSAR
jgi:hypothetical protein